MRAFCGQALLCDVFLVRCVCVADGEARHGTTTHGRISGRSSFAEAVKKVIEGPVVNRMSEARRRQLHDQFRCSRSAARSWRRHNDLRRRGHATGEMWKNKLCCRLAVSNVASDEIAWPKPNVELSTNQKYFAKVVVSCVAVLVFPSSEQSGRTHPKTHGEPADRSNIAVEKQGGTLPTGRTAKKPEG